MSGAVRRALSYLAPGGDLWLLFLVVIGVYAGAVGSGEYFFGFYGIVGATGLFALAWFAWMIRDYVQARLAETRRAAYARGYDQAHRDLAGTFVDPTGEASEPAFVKPRERQRPSGLAERLV